MTTRTRWSILQAVLALLGTFDAGTIFYADQRSIDLPCTTGGGCSLVAASHWSHVDGFPVALLGAIAYIVLALLSVAKLYSETDRAARLASWTMVAVCLCGTVFSWYLQYVAAVYIGAFCIWCRVSATIMTVLFLSAVAERIAGWRLHRSDSARARQAPI